MACGVETGELALYRPIVQCVVSFSVADKSDMI